MKYFSLGSDGHMYNLCDCGDMEAAEESARDVMPEGVAAVWIADAVQAEQWLYILFNAWHEGVSVCEECGSVNDDNPSRPLCKTCEDWIVEDNRAFIESLDSAPTSNKALNKLLHTAALEDSDE